MKTLSCKLLLALTLALPLAGARAAIFTTNATIAVGDTTYDGQPIVVSNCTLTVNGAHSFASLLLASNAALTHASAPDAEADNRLDLTIAGNATVDVTSAINAVGLGYAANKGPGRGSPSSWNAPGGGGHGGNGGDGTPGDGGGGAIYGSITAPITHGSGGNYHGGAGGGVIRLAVGGTLTVDGVISASGDNGAPQSGGGGAGGSVFLSAATLAGTGSIRADGGGGGVPGNDGGGGGGRLALLADTLSFSGSLSAVSGTGFQAGGAGTIFTRVAAEPFGRLRLDNAGRTGYTRFGSTNWPAGQVFALSVAGAAILVPLTPLTVSQLEITTAAMLTHDRLGQPLRVEVLDSVVIGTGASINADGAGYYGTNGGPGGGGASSENACRGGAGHGGDGGQHMEGSGRGPTYGSLLEPLEFGSTTPGTPGSYGGGSVRLAVRGRLTVDGTITAGGQGSRAAGGSIYLTCAELAGGGQILALGSGAGNSCSGGGGGGRIALYAGTMSFLGATSAAGGPGGSEAGGAGTIFTRLGAEPVGRLLLDNAGRGGYTHFSSTNWPPDQVFALTLAGSARLALLTPMTVSQPDITTGALLTHDRLGQPLRVNVLNSAVIGAGASVNVDGLGYIGNSANMGPGFGSMWSINGCFGGAGHGGYGGQNFEGRGRGGIYGSYLEPVEFGSASQQAAGGYGGGSVRLAVGGTLTLEGTITAGGQGPSAAGGSVYLACAELAGGGNILARGSAAASGCSGGGGGGRIAVHAGTMSFLGTKSVDGGPGGAHDGFAGTIYLTNNAALCGTVRTSTQQGLAGATVSATGGYSTFTDA